MYKSLLFVFFLVLSPVLKAESLGGVSFGISHGVEKSSLDWDIGSNHPLPNVLSHLQWQDMLAYKTQLDSEIWFQNSLVVTASIARADIYSGVVRDSDYLFNDRQGEFSRSYSDAGGYTTHGSIAFGLRQLYVNNAQGLVISITPKLGYRTDQQHLSMKNGRQAISGSSHFDPHQAFAGLDSRYHAQWRGPWLGMEFRAHGDKTQFVAQMAYHKLDYNAEADWNLRSDFQHPVSYKHTAKADGFSMDIDYERRLSDNIWGQLKFNYQLFNADEGRDTTYFSNGSEATIKLNQVSWKQISVQLGATIRY